MSAPSLPLPRRVLRARAIPVPRPEVLALLGLAAVLNLWALSRNGVANDYYAAAVQAMASSWHAFLYGSFDASGVMTVDKPPLALWVQALSVRAFGWSSWSLLVPQALMGVATTWLTYDLVRRPFGRAAGTVAGLVLALTPITVAIARHNNPDALLILCVTAALWCTVRGLADGRLRWMVLAGVLVGLGFETKMAAALLVVPGIVAAWLWVAPGGTRLRATGQLAVGGAAMTLVGLAWPILMWLTPATQRPWISGTTDNSVWSLILGYNGLGRLFGQAGGNTGGGFGGGGGGGGVFGGEPGVTRLLNSSLGGQVGWLLGVAVVGLLGVAVATRLRRTDPRTGWLLAVGGAGLVTAVAFSRAAGIFHPYYVAALAPMAAALVGGAYALASGARTVAADGGLAARAASDATAGARERTARWVGPAAVAAGALVQFAVMRSTGSFGAWAPVMVGGGLGLAVLLALRLDARTRRIAATAATVLLLAAPATWAVQTLGHATSSTFPAGGPAASGMTMGGGPGGGTPGGGGARGGTGGGGMFAGDTSTVTEAVAYASANGGGTVAVASQSSAASVTLTDTSADVVGIGGFSGSESEVTLDWLADQVESGAIRYVVVSDSGRGFSDGRTGASAVLAAAAEVGTPVGSVDGLYDLQGAASALRAAG